VRDPDQQEMLSVVVAQELFTILLDTLLVPNYKWLY